MRPVAAAGYDAVLLDVDYVPAGPAMSLNGWLYSKTSLNTAVDAAFTLEPVRPTPRSRA
jgi:hypothetical protein